MKEWYFIGNKTKPNMLGGYENQSFLDYKEDAFAESLETDIASTVLLFNHDLSRSKELRGVIQGNVADSSLKSMERCILVPIGTLHSGNYIFFEDEYWLIDGRPGNNGEYEKAVLKECQYNIKWQKEQQLFFEYFIFCIPFYFYNWRSIYNTFPFFCRSTPKIYLYLQFIWCILRITQIQGT